MIEFKDPKRLLDRAAIDGYVAVDFTDPVEARRFAKRLRRILAIGAEQLVRRARHGVPLTPDYEGAQGWEPLYINQREGVVEVINVEHPTGRAHLPQFQLRGV